MNAIKQLFGRVFGNNKPTTATQEWPEKISATLKEVEAKPRKIATEVYESRWGYHPVSYETFLKLKELHKWYHMTLRHLGTWVRWDRKTVHQHGPEPKYCPTFVENRPEWRDFVDADGNYHCRYYPKKRVDHGICEAYHQARMPRPKEDVEPLDISVEEIDRLHTEVSAWFKENL